MNADVLSYGINLGFCSTSLPHTRWTLTLSDKTKLNLSAKVLDLL